MVPSYTLIQFRHSQTTRIYYYDLQKHQNQNLQVDGSSGDTGSTNIQPWRKKIWMMRLNTPACALGYSKSHYFHIGCRSLERITLDKEKDIAKHIRIYLSAGTKKTRSPWRRLLRPVSFPEIRGWLLTLSCEGLRVKHYLQRLVRFTRLLYGLRIEKRFLWIIVWNWIR